MAKGHAVGNGTAHTGGHVHHLSAAPIVVAIGALFAYIGLAGGLADLVAGTFTLAGGSLVLGALIFLVGIGIWIKEDIGMWNDRYVDHGVLPGRDLGWWGMMFFLGTEVVLFGGLFGAFFVTRSGNEEMWAALHSATGALRSALPLVTVNTLILISSGFTMHFIALAGVKANNRKKFITGMLVTIGLGLTFLIVQMTEYSHLIKEGIILNSGATVVNGEVLNGAVGQFASVFYILTGTHAFHVFLGLVFLTIVLVRGLKGQFDSARHVAVETFGIYWHFVDIVWVLLYFIVYVGVF